MTRQITALAALAVLAACGATPTTSAPAAGEAQANTAPADSSTSRGPNMFGSGN